MSSLEQAIELLKPMSGKYAPKQGAYYLLKVGKDRGRDDGNEECCPDCRRTMVRLANKKRPLTRKFKWISEEFEPTFGGNLASAMYCQYCKTYIDEPITPDKQELEHWESVKLNLYSESECWELANIFENAHQDDKYYDRVVALAERVIKEKEVPNAE